VVQTFESSSDVVVEVFVLTAVLAVVVEVDEVVSAFVECIFVEKA
jgi:hypothetical protein